MSLNSSGQISLLGNTAGQSIEFEMYGTSSNTISLLDANVRSFCNVSSGPVTMPTNFYGKSSSFVLNVLLTTNTPNYNVRAAAIAAGWDQVTVINATITVNAYVQLYATTNTNVAFTTGTTSYPVGSTLSLINNGYITGAGGFGGSGNTFGSGGGGGIGGGTVSGNQAAEPNGGTAGFGLNGNAGGNAGGGSSLVSNYPFPYAPQNGAGGASTTFSTTYNPYGYTSSQAFTGGNGTAGGLAMSIGVPISITNNGTIGGGGGGGGAGGGYAKYNGAGVALNYTTGTGGDGGSYGAAGNNGSASVNGGTGGTGGAAGAALTGNTNITWVTFGTVLGARS